MVSFFFFFLATWDCCCHSYRFNGLDDPVEELAPKAAAVGACVAASYVAHFPLLGLIVPRLLELGGVYVCGKAVGRYAEAGSVSLKADLVRVGDEAGDIVKSVLGK
jgi:hypothetical protein